VNIYLNSVRSPLPLRHHVQCSILPLAVPEFAVGSPNKFGAPDLAKKTARREVKFSHLMYLGRGEVQVGRRGPSGQERSKWGAREVSIHRGSSALNHFLPVNLPPNNLVDPWLCTPTDSFVFKYFWPNEFQNHKNNPGREHTLNCVPYFVLSSSMVFQTPRRKKRFVAPFYQ